MDPTHSSPGAETNRDPSLLDPGFQDQLQYQQTHQNDGSGFDMSAYQNFIQVDPSTGLAYRFDTATNNMVLMDPQPTQEQVQQSYAQQEQFAANGENPSNMSAQQGGVDQDTLMAMMQSNPQLIEIVQQGLQQGIAPEIILQFLLSQQSDMGQMPIDGQGGPGQPGMGAGQNPMFQGVGGHMQPGAGGPSGGGGAPNEKEELVTYNWKGKQLTRRKRTKLTEEQIKVLEFEYAQSTMPGPKIYKRISNQLGLSHDSVINWFQNRRKREKRHTQKVDDPNLLNPFAMLSNPILAAMMNPLLMMAMQSGGAQGMANPMMNPMMQMMMMQGMGIGPDGQPLSEGGGNPMLPDGLGGGPMMQPPMGGMPGMGHEGALGASSGMDPSQMFGFPSMMDPALMMQMQQNGFLPPDLSSSQGGPAGMGGAPDAANGGGQQLTMQQSLPFGMQPQQDPTTQFPLAPHGALQPSGADLHGFAPAQTSDDQRLTLADQHSPPISSQPLQPADRSSGDVTIAESGAVGSGALQRTGVGIGDGSGADATTSFFNLNPHPSMTSPGDGSGDEDGHAGQTDQQQLDTSSAHLLGGILDPTQQMANFSDPAQLLQEGAGDFSPPAMNPFLLQQMGMGMGGVNPLIMMAALRGSLGGADDQGAVPGRPSEFQCAACGQVCPWPNKGTRVTIKNNLGPMIRQKREFFRKDFTVGDVFCMTCHESSRGGVEDEPDDDFDDFARMRARAGLNAPYKDRPTVLSGLFEGLRFAFPRRLHALKYSVEQHSGSATFMTSKAIKKKEIRRMPDPPTHFIIPDDTVTDYDPRVSELIKRGTICVNDRFVRSCIDNGTILNAENFPVRWKAAGTGGDSDDSDHEGQGNGQPGGQPDYAQLMQMVQQQMGPAGVGFQIPAVNQDPMQSLSNSPPEF